MEKKRKILKFKVGKYEISRGSPPFFFFFFYFSLFETTGVCFGSTNMEISSWKSIAPPPKNWASDFAPPDQYATAPESPVTTDPATLITSGCVPSSQRCFCFWDFFFLFLFEDLLWFMVSG